MTSMKVCCRFRPQNGLEKSVGGYSVIQISEDASIVRVNPPPESSYTRAQDFNFDRCFATDSAQPIVFEYTASHMIQQVFGGFNATIFAYGQTGAGKTYSMEGQLGSPNRGIVPRVVEAIFEQITEADEGLEFLLKISYVEIYLEGLRDLLNTSNSGMKIREGKHGVYIDGVTELYVRDASEVMQMMELGSGNRTTNATNMNATSSRSHGVFMLKLESKALDTGSKKMAKLMMVDLAGSEKVGKSGASGQLLEEAKKINQSLSALGNVMNSLSSGKGHVSYRDSVLTRLLSDSLGGNCKTTLLIACSCSSYNADETISTLRFGTRAKKIKNKAKINAEKSVAEYKKEVAMLKAKIEKYRTLVAAYKADMAQVKAGDFDPANSLAEAYLAGEEVTVPVEEEKKAATEDGSDAGAVTEDGSEEDGDTKFDEEGNRVDLDGQLMGSDDDGGDMMDMDGHGDYDGHGGGGGNGPANARLLKENTHLKQKVTDLSGQIRKLANQLQIRGEKLANQRTVVEDSEIEYNKMMLSNRALADSLNAMESEKNRIERDKMESDARADKKTSETQKLREKITLLKSEAERQIRGVRRKEQEKAEAFIRSAQADLSALKRRATHGGHKSVVQMERAMRQQVKQERRNLNRDRQEMGHENEDMASEILELKTNAMRLQQQLESKIDEYLNMRVAMSEQDDEINGLRLEVAQKERKMRTQNAELQALGHLKFETDKYHHGEATKNAEKVASLQRQIIKLQRLNERSQQSMMGGFGGPMGSMGGGMVGMNMLQARQKQAVMVPLRGGGGRRQDPARGQRAAPQSVYQLPNSGDFDMSGGSFVVRGGVGYGPGPQGPQGPHGRNQSFMSAYSANPYGGGGGPPLDEYGLGAGPSPSPQPVMSNGGYGAQTVVVNGSYNMLPHMPEDGEYAMAGGRSAPGHTPALTASHLQANNYMNGGGYAHSHTPSTGSARPTTTSSVSTTGAGGHMAKMALPRGASNSTFVTHGRQVSNASYYKSRSGGGGNDDSFW